MDLEFSRAGGLLEMELEMYGTLNAAQGPAGFIDSHGGPEGLWRRWRIGIDGRDIDGHGLRNHLDE
jgi:hypothetical protein